MMEKRLLILFLFAFQMAYSQLKTATFEQIDSLQNIQKKPIVIFIHTDWCKFCQQMERTTFKDEEVISQLNDHFYFVSFDAESRQKITFNSQEFRFKPSGNNTGVHELAVALGTMDKQIVYPMLCILNDKYEIVFQHNGFLNAKDFQFVLHKLTE